MGWGSFWSSVKDSVSNATTWVAHNSDNIKTAAGIIAKVAPLVAAEEDEFASNPNKLPFIFNGLNRAQGVLLTKMDALLPIPKGADIPNGSDVKTADFQCLIPVPSQSDTGNARQEFYTDISNFLALHNMSSIVKTGTDSVTGSPTEIDLAKLIGQQVFAMAPGKGQEKDDATGIITPDLFTINAPDRTIKGQHLYYEIPLGFNGKKVAWHSHLRIQVMRKSEGKAADADRQGKLKIANTNPPKAPYNATTVKVKWTSAVGTDIIMAAVQSTLLASTGPIQMTFGDLFHSPLDYTYQVYTSIDIGPGAVQQAFTDAIQPLLLKSSAAGVPAPLPKVELHNNASVLF